MEFSSCSEGQAAGHVVEHVAGGLAKEPHVQTVGIAEVAKSSPQRRHVLHEWQRDLVVQAMELGVTSR